VLIPPHLLNLTTSRHLGQTRQSVV